MAIESPLMERDSSAGVSDHHRSRREDEAVIRAKSKRLTAQTEAQPRRKEAQMHPDLAQLIANDRNRAHRSETRPKVTRKKRA